MRKKRPIRLTLQPMVWIWGHRHPLIATAEHRLVDNVAFPYESTRKTMWFLGVRRKLDGSEVIVYAKYRHQTRWTDEKDRWAEYGELLRNPTAQQVEQAVFDVAEDIEAAEHRGNDADLWRVLVRECLSGVRNFYS